MSSRWGWAVGGSFVIHGLLFGVAWRARPRAAVEVAPARAPLAVQLWEAQSAAAAAPKVAAPFSASPSTPLGTGSVEGHARAGTSTPQQAHPAIAAEPTALSEEGPGLNGGGGGGDEAGASPSTPLGTSSGGGGGSPGASGPDLTALHQRLAEAAQSCYPAAARRLRLSGQLELAFCASADGRASNPSLGSSSGSELLDRAALDCLLDRAAPLPVRSGCFRVPVRFGMP